MNSPTETHDVDCKLNKRLSDNHLNISFFYKQLCVNQNIGQILDADKMAHLQSIT